MLKIKKEAGHRMHILRVNYLWMHTMHTELKLSRIFQHIKEPTKVHCSYM